MHYQYHIFNQHISFLITTDIKNEEYAIAFGKRVAADFYDFKEHQLDDVKCNFIVEFRMESVINLDRLSAKS